MSGSNVATAEEIRQATFDARCQASSGYLRALYDAEWERQIPLLRDNADALERVKAQNAAYENRLAQIIGDHAPERK